MAFTEGRSLQSQLNFKSTSDQCVDDLHTCVHRCLQPDRTAGQPDRTAGQPDRTARQPDRTARQPDRTARQPDRTARQPDRTARQPDRTARQPDRHARQPDRTARQPDRLLDNWAIPGTIREDRISWIGHLTSDAYSIFDCFLQLNSLFSKQLFIAILSS